jgi:hypothetical protein
MAAFTPATTAPAETTAFFATDRTAEPDLGAVLALAAAFFAALAGREARLAGFFAGRAVAFRPFMAFRGALPAFVVFLAALRAGFLLAMTSPFERFPKP